MNRNKPTAPRLDRRTRSGLRHIASLVEAGGCENVFGSEVEIMERDGRLHEWQDVLRAVAWIYNLPD